MYFDKINKLFSSFFQIDISLSDVENVNNPIDKVVAGLQSNSGGDQKIPLTAVHVRAKLQDLTSEVCDIISFKSNFLIMLLRAES